MKIIDRLSSGKVTVSCELFPPKAGKPLEDAKRIVRETAKLSPSYISVTCGAGGTTNDNTIEIASEVQRACGCTALAHVVCMGSTKEKIAAQLRQLKSHGIENVLALRGDVPLTGDTSRDYEHASDLIEEIARNHDFCIGAACYPEGHPESPSLRNDIDGLKRKIDAGAQFLTTQMFFDNNILYNFMFRLLRAGVNVPVTAGIMPITDARQIERTIKLSNASLPQRFYMIVDRFRDRPASMKQAGIAYATEQIIDLIANGIDNIHIYTMNKPDIAGSIIHNLSEIFDNSVS
ncbi:MAG: methylenetetrahydrofolate reductase [NAD(P)H] [Clostridia bacterium]|nr:methylenetetrahydrofolate reductase [NAD(P)H] [Clostridia bacterium]